MSFFEAHYTWHSSKIDTSLLKNYLNELGLKYLEEMPKFLSKQTLNLYFKIIPAIYTKSNKFLTIHMTSDNITDGYYVDVYLKIDKIEELSLADLRKIYYYRKSEHLPSFAFTSEFAQKEFYKDLTSRLFSVEDAATKIEKEITNFFITEEKSAVALIEEIQALSEK